MKKKSFLNAVIVLAILFCTNGISQERLPPIKTDLKSAIQTALQNNLELKIEKYKIDQAQADIARVYAEFRPQIQSTVGVGPINKVVGNSLDSKISYDEWGIIVMGSFDALWPIYTWNRKDDLLNAANSGVIVKEEDAKLKKMRSFLK